MIIKKSLLDKWLAMRSIMWRVKIYNPKKKIKRILVPILFRKRTQLYLFFLGELE